MALNLGKQVGPLPVGAWIGVVGGGLLIGWYFSKSSAKNNASADTPLVPTTDPGVGTGGGQFIYDPPTSVDNPGNTDQILDNATWGRRATNWLIAQGYNPDTSQTAVTKFLSGVARSVIEQSLINLALVKFGTPPEGVLLPEPTMNPGDPTPPKTIPQQFTFHTVRPGDTIGTLAVRYGTSWWNIYVANDMVGLRPDGSRGVLSGPWAFKVGMRLVIPTSASGGLRKPPAQKAGPIRYYTAVNGDTVTTVATKFHIHPANVFEANDVVGMRADGTRGFLVNPSQKIPAGKRLVIPYQ